MSVADKMAGGVVPHPRPWARFFAKSADVMIALPIALVIIVVSVFVFGAVLFATFPQAAEYWVAISEGRMAGAIDTILGLVLLAVVFPIIEGTWIAVFGTMPGKWTMGIRLRDRESGKKLSLGKSISRSYGAYFWGLGLAIPLVALFTQIRSYGYLKAHGVTRWDVANGVVFETRRVAWFRWAIAIVFVAIISVMLQALPA